MLAGIVAMQVEVLKLGASMGRSLERNSVLSSENAALRQSVATLGDDQRIEQLAGTMGMVMPPPAGRRLPVGERQRQRGPGARNIHQPSASSFLSLTPTNGEIVTSATLAAANVAAGSTDSTSTIGSTPTSSTTTPTVAASTSDPATSAVAAAPTAPSSDASSTAATPTARHARAHLILQRDELESGGHAVIDRRFVHGTVDRRRRRRSALDHQRGLADPWRGSIVASASSSLRS